MIELPQSDFYVTAHFNDESKYILDYIDEQVVLLNDNTNSKEQVIIWPPAKYMQKQTKNKYGLITNYVNSHFDRIRISPISGCNNSCAFCSMNRDPYVKNSIEELDAAFKVALEDDRITHTLISGGSPKEEDLEYLTEVYEYFVKKYPEMEFDVMMTPRGFNSYYDKSQYRDYLIHLKEVGVKGLSINVELFNDALCKKYCSEKFKIGKENYLYFLKLAGEIFGSENVRSGLIVGLEDMNDTLIGVEELCKCGVMPMLSPYAPYANIGTWPSSEYLLEVYNETNKILNKYNIPLGPVCKKCRHNTL